MDSFINGGSSLKFTSTPAAMSSFFATQTRFTTPGEAGVTNTAASATPTDPAQSTSDLPNTRLSSGLGENTISRTSGQTTTVGATASNTSNGSGSAIITTSSSISVASPAAASSTDGSSVLSASASCNGISCSPALQAAVAVPVTLVSLVLLAAFFFFLRRRRQGRSSAASVSSVSNGEPRGSRWARHLRVFSFDAELLVGAHSSTNNSIRSAPTIREQPSQLSLRSHQVSVRSLESPAPPYRDALTAPAPGGLQMSERPDSQLTAPPPYIIERAAHRSTSRLSSVARPGSQASDPFADPEPEEEEPSPPPSRKRSHARKSSSAYHPLGPLTSHPHRRDSISDGGSILEAVIGGPSTRAS